MCIRDRIITASQFVGDGSELTGVSGFATAMSNDQYSILNDVFTTGKTDTVAAGTSVLVESNPTAGYIAFTRAENIVVCILDRPRHQELINEVISTGARIKLIPDGDVSAVIATSIDDSGIDLYMGTGGSPEGVLAAAALRCLGGKIYTKLIYDNDESFERAKKMGVIKKDQIFETNDLAKGDVMFSATGVTDGTLLKGVRINNNYALTHSVVMRSKTSTIRYINANHNLNIKKYRSYFK